MTAPESSPKLSPWTKESAEACLITTDGNGKENKRRALRFLIKQATEAAIQRGDGQCSLPVVAGVQTSTPAHSLDQNFMLVHGTPPAAKPNETSGATPSSDELDGMLLFLRTGTGPDLVIKKEIAAALERMSAELNAVRKSSGAAGAEALKQDHAFFELNQFEAELRFAYEKKFPLPPSYFDALKSKILDIAAKSTPGVAADTVIDRAISLMDKDSPESAYELLVEHRKLRAVKHEVPREADQEQTGGATS